LHNVFTHQRTFTRPSGYKISRSVRLRSSATAYFSRTPTIASNRKTWTWSGWVKRGKLSSIQAITTAPNGGAEDSFAFQPQTPLDGMEMDSQLVW